MATKKQASTKQASSKQASTKKAAKKKAAKKAAKKKAALQTQPTAQPVSSFLAALNEPKRADCLKIAKWMAEASGESPKMWGPSIVGFGSRLLRYDSGRELEWMRIGFSPRSQAITLYLSEGVLQAGLLAGLGKHTTGKGCLYLKSPLDVDESVLKNIIKAALSAVAASLA